MVTYILSRTVSDGIIVSILAVDGGACP